MITKRKERSGGGKMTRAEEVGHSRFAGGKRKTHPSRNKRDNVQPGRENAG